MSVSGRLLALVLLTVLLPACSIKKMAVNRLGDALAGTGSTFASDDDPELVGEAVPFGLKTMESLLAESPRHKGPTVGSSSRPTTSRRTASPGPPTCGRGRVSSI
jgi:hypothetical protein